MLKQLMTPLVAAGLLLVSLSVQAADTVFDWELAKEDEERKIKVYLSDVEGSNLKAFRGEAELNAPVWKVLALIEDEKAGPKWMHETKEFRFLDDRSDPSSNLSYSITSVPWPLKNRDLVVRTTVEVDNEKQIVTMHLKDEKGTLPENDDNVRVPYLRGEWIISRIDDNTSHIVYQIHALPGGSIPSWLANAFVVDNPYVSLKNMQKMLASGEFSQKRPDYFK